MKRKVVFDRSIGVTNISDQFRGNYEKTYNAEDVVPISLKFAQDVSIDNTGGIESIGKASLLDDKYWENITLYNGNIVGTINGHISVCTIANEEVGEIVISDVVCSGEVSWCEINGALFFVSGESRGVINGTTVSDWPTGKYGRVSDRVFSGPPKGSRLAWFLGRAWISNENYLFFSEPISVGLFDIGNNFIGFDGDILNIATTTGTMFVFTSNGISVVSGSGVKDLSIRKVFSGTAKSYSTCSSNIGIGASTDVAGVLSNCILWANELGVFAGFDGGEIKRVSGETLMRVSATKSAIVSSGEHIYFSLFEQE